VVSYGRTHLLCLPSLLAITSRSLVEKWRDKKRPKDEVFRVAALLLGPAILIFIGLTTKAYLAHKAHGLSGPVDFAFDWEHSWWTVLNLSLLAQADLFGFGMVAAIGVELIRTHKPDLRPKRWVKALRIATILAVTAEALQDGGHFATPVIGVCAAALVFVTVLPGRQNPRTLSPEVWNGRRFGMSDWSATAFTSGTTP
jgi:hypothetical protein